MNKELTILMSAATAIAFLHTLAGPDHYVPFIALSKARGWSKPKAIGWTIVCGCGHVWSSVALGLLGAALGWSISKTGWLEELRGGIAGWFMLLFGLGYGVWGLYRASKNRVHKHFESDEQGELYVFEHQHQQPLTPKERFKVTPWVMFVIFVLGPCEPMIPLLYAPAAHQAWWAMLLMIGVYTFVTLATMVAMVMLGYSGLAWIKLPVLEKYMHALGGLTIFLCGLGMVWLDW